MDDKSILELYYARDERAVGESMEHYGGRLGRFAQRFLSDKRDAEECVNDVFIRAWNTIPPKRPDDLFVYLAALCRNTAFDIIKKNTAQKRSATLVELTQEMSECIPAPEPVADERAEMLSGLINEYLADLSPDKRRIFIGRYWYGESISDIAAATGFSESKIKTSLHRTREGLKKYIIKKGGTL